MKRMILSLVAVLASVSAFSMTAYRARSEAWFLTDKMAYELYLSENQIQDVYETNYDYFRYMTDYRHVYTVEYERRYEALSYVLTAWQWHRFVATDDFLRPVKAVNNIWVFPIHSRYTKGQNYYNKPKGYSSYAGGNRTNMKYYKDRQSMHQKTVARQQKDNRVDRKYTTPSYVNRHDEKNRPQAGQQTPSKQDSQQKPQVGQPQAKPQQNNSRGNNSAQGQSRSRNESRSGRTR